MLPEANQTWQNPRILGTLLLVFLSGGAVGSITMRSFIHEKMHYRDLPKPPISEEKLKQQLDLTPQQCGRLKAVLADYAMFQSDIQEQMESFRATGQRRILEILDERQKKEFERISKDALAP